MSIFPSPPFTLPPSPQKSFISVYYIIFMSEDLDSQHLGFYKQKAIIKKIIYDIFKKECPCKFERIRGIVQDKTGLSKRKTIEYLEMFNDIGIIKIDRDTRMCSLCRQK